MLIEITDVIGNCQTVELKDVGNVYAEDDIIYFENTAPCILSTARPHVPDLLDTLQAFLDTESEITAFVDKDTAQVYSDLCANARTLIAKYTGEKV